jgi:glycerate-2-kinase
MLFKDEKQLIDNGKNDDLKQIRKDIIKMLKTAIESVDAYQIVSSSLQKTVSSVESEKQLFVNFSNIFVVAFGKASIRMSQAVIDKCCITKGIVITNDETKKISHPNIKTFHGGHPLPNNESVKGTKEIEKLIKKISKNDLLIVLISGGGSSLLCHPRTSLEDIQKITEMLLKSGANIKEINTIRKHLSYVKGGQLISNIKGQVISYIISDIIGDPVGFIASGPTVGDNTTYLQAKKIFLKYNLWKKIPLSAQSIINKGIKKEIPETPSEEDYRLKNVSNQIIANNTLACKALDKKGKELGYTPFLLSTSLQGNARLVGNFLIKKLIKMNKKKGINMLIAGGETTVLVKGKGKGGRNQEMVLSALKNLQKYSIVFASFGTDGIDGTSTAAGAIADPYSLNRSIEKNLKFDFFLRNNNSNVFFNNLQDLLISGPTGTNVMDIQILIKINCF